MEIPKKLIKGGSTAGSKKNQIICETCHTVHGSPNESFLIESARNSALCLECHSDKKMFSPDGKRNPLHVINVKPVNAKIPDELIKEGAKLGNNGELICQTCHKVHRNRIDKKLLLIKKNENSSLCLNCHTDKQYLSDTRHNLMHSSPEEKNLEGKTVAESGICSACHLPHKASRKIDGDEDYATLLCLSCHSKGGIAEKALPGDYMHPTSGKPFENNDSHIMLTTLSIENDKLTLPLFNKYGIQDKNGKLVCSTCHDPHRWRPDSTKGEIREDVKGDKMTSFLRKAAPEICRECHSDKFYIENSEHDISKVAPEAKNVLNQTPSESGLCGTCHNVHRGKKNYLWAREITTESGIVVQDMCVSCHNKNGMANEKVLTDHSHPVNVSPSEKGLKTTLPLFDKEGNVSESGVMTCQTCHDPHCWSPVKVFPGAHYDLEGNSQNSFLRLETSPSPRLCENCHPDEAYIAKTDHDLLITAPEEKNIIEQTPAESGTCGVCHLTHNSENKFELWAKSIDKIPPDKGVMNILCTGCHSEGNSAEKKSVLISTHPEEVVINNSLRNDKRAIDFFPIYDKDGTEITFGNISCASCHDVHKWSPLSKQKGVGENLEGKVINSFLRNSSYNNICVECHGFETLYKFKYFHDPEYRYK
jgi:predicted CXXCH cytochrome family protein